MTYRVEVYLTNSGWDITPVPSGWGASAMYYQYESISEIIENAKQLIYEDVVTNSTRYRVVDMVSKKF